MLPLWALTGHAEDSLVARGSCCWPGAPAPQAEGAAGERYGGRWCHCLGPLALSEDAWGLLTGSARVLPAGPARLGSAWPFSLLTESMVFKVVIERDNLELKAEPLIRAVGQRLP